LGPRLFTSSKQSRRRSGFQAFPAASSAPDWARTSHHDSGSGSRPPLTSPSPMRASAFCTTPCFTRLVSLLRRRLYGYGGAGRRCASSQWNAHSRVVAPCPAPLSPPHTPPRRTAVSRIMRACVGQRARLGSSAGIDARRIAAHRRRLPIRSPKGESTEMGCIRVRPNRIVGARSIAVVARAVIAVPVAGCAPPSPSGQASLNPQYAARFKYPDRFAPATGAIGGYAWTMGAGVRGASRQGARAVRVLGRNG
jgi:hypothetical protein